jgi:N-methylhydantoinase A
MLVADVIKDYSITVMLPGNTPHAALEEHFAPLMARGIHEVTMESSSDGIADIKIQQSLDLRYRGQSYELNVAYGADFIAAFHTEHEKAYGYNRPDADIEIVSIRVKAVSYMTPPEIKPLPFSGEDASHALLGFRMVQFESPIKTPFYRGEARGAGNIVYGPAIVIRSDTTILLDQGDRAIVDAYGNLVVSVCPILAEVSR